MKIVKRVANRFYRLTTPAASLYCTPTRQEEERDNFGYIAAFFSEKWPNQ